MVYNCIIKGVKNGIVNVDIDWEQINVRHEKLKKEKRCTGNERRDIAKNLIAHGNSNIRNDHLLHNFLHDGILIYLQIILFF